MKYEIPLTPVAQSFSISLAGQVYRMKLVWNESLQSWILDIATRTGSKLVSGIPLVTGVDLLEPYAELNFGGKLTVSTDNAPARNPTYENLGITSHLFFTAP